MQLLVLLLMLWLQDDSTEVVNIKKTIKQVDKNLLNKKAYNTFIDNLSIQIAAAIKKDESLKLELSYLFFSYNLEVMGTATSSLVSTYRKILNENRLITYPMLALAMNNDTPSINLIKNQLLSSDFGLQFTALKSLAIMSLFDSDNIKKFKNMGQSHWFPPLNKATQFAINYLKKFKEKVTPWDVYQLNKIMEDVFWQEVDRCNLAEPINEIGIIQPKIKLEYLKVIDHQSTISLKNAKLLAENQNQFKAIIQSYNKLILINKNNKVITVNTMAERVVFSFDLGKRNFLILRGLDSIGFDRVSELVLIDNRYILKSKFRLPYSSRKIHDKTKSIIIDGNTWNIKINKEQQLIEKATICNEARVVNIKI